MKKTIITKALVYSLLIISGVFVTLWVLLNLEISKLNSLSLSSLNSMRDQIIAGNTEIFKKQGEENLREKSVSIADEIKNYLRSRGKLHRLSLQEMAQLQKDERFKKLAIQPIGKTGYTAMIDLTGTTRFHPNPEMINTTLTEISAQFPQLARIFEKAMKEGFTSGYYAWKDPDGKIRDKFLAFAPVEGTNLILGTTTYIDEFFTPIEKMKKTTFANISRHESATKNKNDEARFWLIIITMLAGIATIGIVYFSTKKFTKPILSLTKYASEISKGNFGINVDIKTGDELEILANTFNEMASRLKNQYSGLEEANKKLMEANEKFAELDKMKSEFISIASHELKTPLATIRGFADILHGYAQKSDSEMCKNHLKNLDVIIKETDRLARIVDELLDISIIESGLMELHLKPVKLQDTAKKVVESFCLREEGYRFNIEIPEDFPEVLADGDMTEQLFTNLVSNAVNYSPLGKTITIKGVEKENEVEISVSDEGIGIPKSDLGKVFNKLYRRKEDETIQKIKGVGLGLAICRGIINLHHGKIRAESEGENKGARFVFAIPKKGRRINIIGEVEKFLGK